MNHAAILNRRTWVLLATVLFCSQAVAANINSVKMSAPISAVERAVASGQQDSLMQAALTRQLFRENGPLALRWNASGSVQVYIHYAQGGVLPDAGTLQQLGATDIRSANLMGVVQAWVPANKLTAIAALPWVQRLTLPHYAIHNAARGAATPRASSTPPSVDQFFGAAAPPATAARGSWSVSSVAV